MKAAYLVFLIGIAALPSVYFITGAAIPFGNDWFCDTWYYFGLMEFPELGHVLAPGARTISRLPAYVPVSALRELGATATNQDLYFWLNHILFVAATAAALTALFEITTALIVTALVTTSALYLAVLSTTYPTGAALAYGSAALACVAIALRAPRFFIALSFIGGIFLAFSLHSHLVAAVFMFFLPILYFMIDVRAFVVGALAMCAGMIAGTGLVGMTGLYLGQGFWSFENQILAVVSGIGVYWYNGWILRSIGLLLMVLLPVLQTITFVGRKRDSKRSLVILVSAIAVSVINIVVTFAHKDQNLVFNFMYVMAIPVAVLVIADAIEDRVVFLGPLRCGIILATLMLCHIAIMTYLRHYILLYFMPIASLGALFAIVASWLYARSRSTTGGIVIVIGLFIFMQGALGDYYRDHLYLDRTAAKGNTQQIDKALRFMRDFPITDKPVVWLGKVDNQAVETAIFQSLVRCGFSIDFPDKFPDSDKQWQPALTVGHLLIVMDDPKKYPKIEETLAQKGITLANAKSEKIDDRLSITMGKIAAVAPQ